MQQAQRGGDDDDITMMVTEITLTKVLANLNLHVKILNVFRVVILVTLATTLTSKTKEIQVAMQQVNKEVEMMMMTEITLTKVLANLNLHVKILNV